MPDTVAKIRAKGLEATGITEDLAEQMYATLGRYTIGIVELKHEAHSVTADGSKKVELVITLLEPAVDDTVEEHLRELTRTMHQNRAMRAEDGQLTLASGDGIAPKVSDVLAAGAGLKAHDFVPDDSDPEGRCEHGGCRKPEDDSIHTLLDDLEDPEHDDDQDDEDDEDEDGDEDGDQEETGGDTSDAEPQDGWDEDYPQGQPARPLTSVPDPFTA